MDRLRTHLSRMPLFEDLKTALRVHSENESERAFRVNLLRTTTFIMSAMGLPAFHLYWSLGVRSVAWGIVASVSVALVNLWILERTKRVDIASHVGMASIYLLLLFDNLITGGFDRPNFAWLYVLPMVAASILDLRGAWIWLGVTLTTITGFWLLPEFDIFLVSAFPPELERGQALFSRITAVTSLGLVATGFILVNRRSKRALETANHRLALETKYVQLLQTAAMSSNEAISLEAAIEQSLDRITALMGWEIGRAYGVGFDGLLAPMAPTCRAANETNEEALQIRLASGEMLADRALRLEAPAFWNAAPGNGASDASFSPEETPRPPHRSAVALPVVSEESVIAILEFVTAERLEASEHLAQVLAHVGIEIGRVAERNKLQTRLRQSQRAEAVGQLAAGMAHEINNPMAYVRSSIQQLCEELEHEETAFSSDRRADWLELVQDSVEGIERTIAIVNEVKECGESHDSGGRISDLNRIVSLAHQQVSSRFASETTFDCVLSESLPQLHCLPNQLERAFVNLIQNAAQAAGPRGGVETRTGSDRDAVWVRITDDGPGIPDEHRNVLFDPFFTTRRVGEGTGLGLYVAFEIVGSHGGEILVESAVGQGSLFEVRLPIEPIA